MKKLFFLILGLNCINTYAVDPTQGPLQQDSSLCGYGYNPNCRTGNTHSHKVIQYVDVHVPSKYGAYASNAKTGIGGGY